MAKGGARRGAGRIAASVSEKQAIGAKVRARNRVQRSAGRAMRAEDVPPPPHLNAGELEQWAYYSRLLAEEGRLTLKARDCLAKYCSLLALLVEIKALMAAPEYGHVLVTVTNDSLGNQHVSAKANPLLIQQMKLIAQCRGYENDLLMCPAAAVRVPAPDQPEVDESDEFGLGGGPRLVKR